jgi:hypothetical protein
MAIGSRCTLAAQGKDGGSAVELALLGLHYGWRRAKLGGGQRPLLHLHCLACACRSLQGVGGSALARELAALLGCWQRRVGVGTLSRQAADALSHAACLRPRVKVGGGSCTCFSRVTSRVAQGKNGGRQQRLLRLHCLARACERWRGAGGSVLVGDVGASAVAR